MLIHFGQNRSASLDRRLACSLAFVAGALNSAGFYSLGFFAANMTGNVSAGADKIALGDMVQGAAYLLLPVAFIFGAALAAALVDYGLRRGVNRIYAWSILSEALMLTLLGIIDILHHNHSTVLVLGLSIVMGFQNAVVTRISNAQVRTTHVSGMSTDIGIGIGLLAARTLQGEAHPERTTLIERLRLHGFTVLSFCAGGVLGVVADKIIGPGLLFAAAILLIVLALPSLMAPRTEGDGDGVGQ